MKVKVTEERDCCHPSLDLLPYHGKVIGAGKSSVRFCKHCGQIHHWVRHPGEMDGGYEAVEIEVK